MALYSIFSCNVEVQYRSYILSKAMLFAIITTCLNIMLPFILAYRSRGFWLKSHHFYEQPSVFFTYNYILIAETNDPSIPIVCADIPFMSQVTSEENCSEFKVEEIDLNNNGRNDILKFKFKITVPLDRTITSIILLVGLDFQLESTCPLHMQSLGIIENEFSHPATGLKYYGDINFNQITQLPCHKNHVDVSYNNSLFNISNKLNTNIIDHLLDEYFVRRVTTQVTTINSRVHYGQTSIFALDVILRVPEMGIRYTPSMMQELKWAWPQYLSIVVIFYWLFNKIKCFVFNNRLVMVWRDVPWKKL